MTSLSMIAVPFATLLLAACGQSPGDGNPTAGDAMPSMPRQAAQDKAEHMAEGTLNSIDRAAGTVNVSHGPVASASWPAMTMSFKLSDPSAAPSLTPGQKIEFHFTIESGMSATVTQIAPAD
jgi:Cu(I)/Ag(I) efflux system membrane fusion protein